ncbi:hypothetical protein ANANG_G00055590 [Anguilla anguilla]|uniref:Uncharacterized protein n=1 Tax=Anguilla anguilla TaxID=7936 RepID=A0A9D3MPT6_ANGAN|nr:hypothetical protein ANANG_G00055590 [Anguilla anguilla]
MEAVLHGGRRIVGCSCSTSSSLDDLSLLRVKMNLPDAVLNLGGERVFQISAVTVGVGSQWTEGQVP